MKRYRYEVIEFVFEFIQKYKLFCENDHLLLALSGGVDSIVLLDILDALKKRKVFSKLSAVYIHHGLREQADLEQVQLEKLVLERGFEFYSFRLNFKKQTDIEFSARKERYKIFLKLAKEKSATKILTGHHLDDSFEWSLMQQFSSSSNLALGIPIINGPYRRPLMCLSKDHILKYARQSQLEWFEDETNRSISYDRNFIRNTIVKRIKAKYPKYLKHYVERSLQKIDSLNEESKIGANRGLQNNTTNLSNLHRGDHFTFFVASNFNENFKYSLLNEIKRLSSKGRGTTRAQINKVEVMIKNGKKGPLLFSGGVELYVMHRTIVLLKKEFSYSLASSQIPEGQPLFFMSSAKNKKSAIKEHPFFDRLSNKNKISVNLSGKLVPLSRDLQGGLGPVEKRTFFYLKTDTSHG
ncbi:tRNA lysidine(34) synthetase TilS [Halobacteriovorax sp. GB3]|uniref:tRNA lysidine(34) synthetase TilS n=1 Tax=Halobacteriovorax sp. GB3 TaxID=2719615 RepID=UPI00235FF123|nr:tRNA lysidine(34) synthetase TilS [Halobacteriovorax sp. GB3]MDD0852969.1 tRNA lysidine(34) synthetase TilS [Halobacteriovorax sp. GB3]